MTYEFTCTQCGNVSEVTAAAKDYETLDRICAALVEPDGDLPCGGTLERSYTTAPSLRFSGPGWTPKHY